MKKVFIVDDSQVIRERIAGMLSEATGIQVCGQAESAVQALRLLKRNPADVLVLDIRLRGDNGFDLLREIRAVQPDLYIIMLTNYPYPQYRDRARILGADRFFDKSTEFNRVIETIRELDHPVAADPNDGEDEK